MNYDFDDMIANFNSIDMLSRASLQVACPLIQTLCRLLGLGFTKLLELDVADLVRMSVML